VQSQGNLLLGTQRLSHYRFRHFLFQHYLYQTLDEGERAYLHEDIGHTLERFYQAQTERVAVQLARHFQAAGLTSKAVDYLQQAAEQADVRLAFREEAGFCNDALLLMQSLPKTAERQKQQVRLQLALAAAQYKTGEIAPSLQSFQQAAEIAHAHQWAEDLAQAALGYEQVRYRFNQPAEPAIRILEHALELIGETDSVLKARIVGQLAQAFFFIAASKQAEMLSLQAVAMARQVDDPLTLFDALYVRALAYRKPENIQARLVAAIEMLQLARTLGDREREINVYTMLTADYLEAGEIEAVDRTLEAHAKFSDDLQQAFLFFVLYVMQSMRATLAGKFAEAEKFAQRALVTGQQMQVEIANGTYGILMFTIQREQGGIAQLTSTIQGYVERNRDSVWHPGLALIYCDLGWVAEAHTQFELLATNNSPGCALGWQSCLFK
jgi:tetratricopeptide (TPR) repeat protein